MSESLQNFLGKYSASNARVIDQTDDILRTEEIEEPEVDVEAETTEE